MIVHTWADQLLPQLLMEQFDTLPSQCRHIEDMHEGVWFKNILFLQNGSIGFMLMIVPSWANQLLPQLLMEQFDILTSQCRHIEHMHDGVWLIFFF